MHYFGGVSVARHICFYRVYCAYFFVAFINKDIIRSALASWSSIYLHAFDAVVVVVVIVVVVVVSYCFPSFIEQFSCFSVINVIFLFFVVVFFPFSSSSSSPIYLYSSLSCSHCCHYCEMLADLFAFLLFSFFLIGFVSTMISCHILLLLFSRLAAINYIIFWCEAHFHMTRTKYNW